MRGQVHSFQFIFCLPATENFDVVQDLGPLCTKPQLVQKERARCTSSLFNMVLYIIGLGLADEKDITVKCE